MGVMGGGNMSDDYGFYGKGLDGYVHYTQSVDEISKGNRGGGGGKQPSGNGRGSPIVVIAIIILIIYIIYRSSGGN
jgi:hypothetical protein